MTAEEQLLEISQEPKSEELAVKLAILQKEALQAKDSETYLKATLLLHDTYVFLQSFSEAANVVREALASQLIEDFKVLSNLSDKLIAILLKTEDFPALQTALTHRERFIVDNPPQILMQKFYWSVCLEGLKKYPEAIAVLEGIGDGISNNNLVSKYLKLAMLQLKVGNPAAARAAFEHATIFDKTRKNEMFHLVESDMLAEEGDYAGALKKYQEFFLKTKIKNRYLDRYIHLNIGLGNYGEAWKFYQEYAAKITQSVSKNYQYQLYRAGLVLAEKMQKFDEAAEIKEKMLAVYSETPPLLDAFDGVRTLLAASQKKSVFQKERDIYLETLRDLGSLLELPGLYFIRPSEDGNLLYQYRKGLLLEKKLTPELMEKTVVARILEEHRDYSLFAAEEITETEEFLPDSRDHVPTACVQAFLVPINATVSGYLVAFLDKDVHFDYVNKLLYTTKGILGIRLGYFDRLNAAKEETLAVKQLFHLDDRGLCKIVQGTLYLMNPKAKEILQAEGDSMPFESFQSRFQTDNPLYLDRLISKNLWNIPILTFQNRSRQMELRVFLQGLTVFLSLRDITDETERIRSLQEKADKAALSPLGSLHRFLDDYQGIKTQSALMTVRIGSDDLFRRGYSENEIRNLAGISHSAFRKAAGAHLIGAYLGEERDFLALLSTTDKRVLDRIFSEGRQETLRAWNLPAADLPPITGGLIHLLKGKTLNENLDRLRFALAYATEKVPLMYYDREMSLKDNRIQSAVILLRDILESNAVSLSYRQTGNLDTRKVEYYRASLSQSSLPGEPSDVDSAIRSLHVGSRIFLILFRQMVADLAELAKETGITVPFGLGIPDEILADPQAADEVLRIVKKAKIPLGEILLIYRLPETPPPAYVRETLRFFQEKTVKIALEGNVSGLRFSDYPWIRGLDYLILPFPEISKLPPDVLESVPGPGTVRIVVNGVDDPETAKSLTRRNLPRIEGNVLPTDLSLASLVKMIQKK